MSKAIPPSDAAGKADQNPERPARTKPPGRSEHLDLELSILETENEIKRVDENTSPRSPRTPESVEGDVDATKRRGERRKDA